MIQIGNIKFYMGPQELNQPDNLEKVIVDFILGAKKELYIAVQEIDSEIIAQAIITARKRKIRIKVIIEGDYLGVDKARANPWIPKAKNEENRQIFNALLRADVNVRMDYNPKIFHQKFIVRDPNDSSASLLTGSTNFTKTGTHSNLNHIVTIKSKRVAQVYYDEFKEIDTGTFGKVRSRFDGPPREYTVSGIPLKILFAPDHQPEMEIMKQMLKARERIDFVIFTFAQSSGIDDTMLALQKGGIKIRGFFDRGQGNQKWAATRILATNKMNVYVNKKVKELNKVHHKLMVIDNEVVIIGSFNYTNPANILNDENIIILGDLELKPKSKRKSSQKLAAYVMKDIEKMIQDFGQKVTK